MLKKTTVIVLTIALSLLQGCDEMGGAAYTDKRPTNINTLRTDQSIDEVLDALKSRADRVAGRELCLNEPADPARLMEVQSTLGQTFPEDVMHLYQRADGQGRDDDCLPLLGQGYWFLSLDDLESAWQHMLDEHKGQMRTEAMYGRQGAVYGYKWHPSWIPVGFRDSGDFLMVDFVPTPMGSTGQIIRYVEEEDDRDHMAMGISHHLAQVLNAVDE